MDHTFHINNTREAIKLRTKEAFEDRFFDDLHKVAAPLLDQGDEGYVLYEQFIHDAYFQTWYEESVKVWDFGISFDFNVDGQIYTKSIVLKVA